MPPARTRLDSSPAGVNWRALAVIFLSWWPLQSRAADLQVQVLAPDPLAFQLNAVRMLDSTCAIAVGEHGTIVRTIDGGNAWLHVNVADDVALKSVTGVSPCVVAVGSRGAIFRSEDDGATWAPARSGTKLELRAAAISPNNTVLVVGEVGTVLRSTDGGKNWNQVASGTRHMLRSVSFSKEKSAMAVGDGGTILTSSDDGLHWQERKSGTWAALRGIHFVDARRGFVVGGDDRRWIAAQVILRTDDAGATWTPAPHPSETRLYSISGYGSTLVTVGEQAAIFRSVDGGAHWKRESIPAPGSPPGRSGPAAPASTASAPGVWLSSVSFSPDGKAIAVGSGGSYAGLIFRSPETGEVWPSIRRERPGALQPYATVTQLSADVWLTTNVRNIQRSTDQGATWKPTKIGKVDNNLAHIAPLDASTAIAVGGKGTLLRTTDAGLSWKKIPSLTERDLQGVAFADTRIGVTVGQWGGDGPRILRTTNGGLGWQPIALSKDDDVPLSSVGFRGSEFGLIVGRGGTILRTSDGGSTWKRVGRGVTRAVLRSVAILDARTALIVGEGGTILRTMNGGDNWTHVPTGQICTLTSVRFGDSRFGVAVGTRTVLFTTDAGNTWRELPESHHLPFSAVLADPRGAFVFGPGSLRMRLELPGGEL
jgi:photosystem II stability/assembly factor-like uncharacterized protein